MKLIDPTDDELNAAFAEKVAGWFKCERLGREVYYDPEGGHVLPHELPRFTQSFDTVLPWLEKWRDRPYLYRMLQIDATHDGWEVKMAQPDRDKDGQQWFWRIKAPSLPRAAAIALLRAHGVEVEFTKNS